MTAIDRITGLERYVLQLEGNIDALETELILSDTEKQELLKRIENLESILKQKIQAC